MTDTGMSAPVCSGCNREITSESLKEHQSYCRLWHMRKVTEAKGPKKKKKLDGR